MDLTVLFAYEAIGKAFSVLSDPKKREQYDRYGSAMEPQYENSGRRSTHGGTQYYYYADDDEDFSAEEIFNMFFGYAGKFIEHIFVQPIHLVFIFHRTYDTYSSTTTARKSISF